MNSIEDRLRDAYRGAAETVDPDTIRELHQRSATISPLVAGPDSRLHRRLVVPLAAASAVALVAVVTAVVIPAALDRARHAPLAGSSPAGRYVVQLGSGRRTSLTIRSLRTASAVATITAPKPGLRFTDVASGDGRTFVAVLSRAGVCQSWLYKFRLSRSGHPTALTALPGTRRSVEKAALGKDDTTLALATRSCGQGGRTYPAELAEINLATRQASQWRLPGTGHVSSLSLNTSGSLLAYTFDGGPGRTALYVVDTKFQAPVGGQQRGPVLPSARASARGDIRTAVITPDGSTVYFITNPTGPASARRWELHAVSLATGHTRIVGSYAGVPGSLAADPSVTRALVVVRSAHRPAPSPSHQPAPSPSGHRTPKPTPTPTPSRHPTPKPTPTASRHPTPKPTPSPSPTGGPGSSRLVLISLGSGAPRFLSSPAWAPQATLAYYW